MTRPLLSAPIHDAESLISVESANRALHVIEIQASGSSDRSNNRRIRSIDWIKNMDTVEDAPLTAGEDIYRRVCWKLINHRAYEAIQVPCSGSMKALQLTNPSQWGIFSGIRYFLLVTLLNTHRRMMFWTIEAHELKSRSNNDEVMTSFVVQMKCALAGATES
jgi:hypothetical protein